MQIPWKQTRVGRISQMVSDLQSPKRGGSMVVQTGFPASLIDLFVKNRDRLRKRSKKHKKTKNSSKGSDVDRVDRAADPVSDTNPTISEVGSGNLTVSVRPSSSKMEDLILEEGDQEEVTSFGSSEISSEESGGGGGDWTTVLLAVVKVFAVVVLAVCTTKLAVGITLSAFVLLLLECFGKYLVCFITPCSVAKSAFVKTAQRVSGFVLVLRGKVIVEEKCECEQVVFELVGSESAASTGEIEIVGSSGSGSTSVGEASSHRSLIEFLVMDDEKWKKVEGGDYIDELSVKVCKKKTNGRKKCVKLIKKLVSKKLRRKSKKHQSGPEMEPDLRSEECVYMVVEGCEEREDQTTEMFSVEEGESLNSSEVSAIAEQGVDTASTLGKGTLDSKKGNLGYLSMCVIALGGLVGGRIVALMLLVSWCFTLKLISNGRRPVDMHMKRCPLPISI